MPAPGKIRCDTALLADAELSASAQAEVRAKLDLLLPLFSQARQRGEQIGTAG